ncbi:uncharacterized protein LOC126980190 isoform X2 [Eriocheir sinensis]|uniref:uncharacterized protein LOC126980190 isoform X2 n=1 Tax=Eriocheir sinensis TaxID=95602 RepID=UPI0021C83392|nr:uncharacterized protein LOC126980190 isoform X2 [Eriocheir sinensis]
MGRLRFLCLALFLMGTMLEVEAQTSYFDKIKNYFDMKFEDIKMKFQGFKTAMGNKFDLLSDKLKNFFNNQNFTSATAADLLAELKGDDWKKMEPAMLMTMPKVQAESLISLGANRDDVPNRFLEELKRLMVLNMTDTDVALSVKTMLYTLNQGEISALLERLGPANTWTSANITSFGYYTLNIPICFDDANDEKVLQAVLDLVNNCDASRPPNGCPTSSEVDVIRLAVSMKLLGAPKNWKMSDVEKLMRSYSDVPYFTVRHTSDSFVTDMKAKLKASENLPTSTSPKLEAWAMEICRVDDCRSKSASAATSWYNELGSMKTAVMPSDVSQAAREDPTLGVQLEANAKNKMPMRAMDAALLLDMKMDKSEPDSISAIGGKLAAWAPACYLREAAENKTLIPVRADVASSLALQRGPEYMAKVNATLRSNMEVAITSDTFRMTSVSSYLKPFVRPEYLREQSSPTLLSVAKLANMNFIQPDHYQMLVMAEMISITDMEDAPAMVRERLPITKMATVGASTLARLSEDMLGITLPCLLGAKKLFYDKTSLRPADLRSGKAFLKCMSFDDASKVNSAEIFDVFEEVREEALSWSACRAFNEKLTDWAKSNLNIGDSENLEEVINSLYVNEIYSIPACVIVAYEPVIYNANMQVKKAVMTNLCASKSYYSIPMDIRRRLINTILPQTIDGPITECGLRRINLCFMDMAPSLLRKMDERAKGIYIGLVQGLLEGGVPLCLDSDQRDEVAEMVLQVKGPAGNWKTASDVSCILDTLSSSAIDRMAVDMPAEVLITTECPKRDYTFSSTLFKGSCMEETEEARMRMKRRKVQRCVKLRETFGTKNSTCDKVMCGNVLRMTSADLERMNKDEVWRLLDGLATEDLDAAKAKVILSKVKEVKGLKDMSAAELERLNYAWRGLTKQDVMDLPKFTSAHMGVIFQLGMTTGLPDDVMMALWDKAKEYKPPSSMDTMDVLLLGGIVCYLTENEVNAIPDDKFKRSIRSLGVRECKNASTTHYLAMKAKAVYGMELSRWDAATVHESGVLVAGLRPEDLAAIPDRAYIGLTASGISKINTEAIKVMTVAQASNLDGSTAAAITSAQMAGLNGNVRLAINNAKSGDLQNSASDVSVPRVLGAVATVLLLLLR